MNANVDINQAWEQIIQVGKSIGSGWGAQHHNAYRDELTKGAVKLFNRYDVNVMVLKKENVVINDPSGKVMENSFIISTGCHCFIWCQTCSFRVMYAPYGHTWSVFNNGDGGYINWSFAGRYSRSGGNVDFY